MKTGCHPGRYSFVIISILSTWFAAAIHAAEDPLRAFVNLYVTAQRLVDNPKSEYDPKNNPDFPYVSDIQKQWSDSMAVNGNQLSPEQRTALIPCAAKVNAAIDSAERGYRIEISQKDNDAAQKTVRELYAFARANLAECEQENALAKSAIVPETKSKPQQTDASQSTTKDPAIRGGTDDYSRIGERVPPSTGEADYNGSKLFINTPETRVGTVYQEPVTIRYGPKIYSRAEGKIQPAGDGYELQITRLWDRSGREVQIPSQQLPIRVPLKPR